MDTSPLTADAVKPALALRRRGLRAQRVATDRAQIAAQITALNLSIQYARDCEAIGDRILGLTGTRYAPDGRARVLAYVAAYAL